MEPTMIDGIAYYPASYFADKWGIKESTIKRYVEPKQHKIKGFIRQGKVLYIQADTIRPLTDSVRQRLLWSIVYFKAGNVRNVDFNDAGITSEQIKNVLRSLNDSGHIAYENNELSLDLENMLDDCWITNKGFESIQYKAQIRDGKLGNAISVNNVQAALMFAQLIIPALQWACGQA